MKLKIGQVLAALVLSTGMVGVAATAHAGGYTMVPAATGLPAAGSLLSYLTWGPVFAENDGGMLWIIPAPNNTGLSGGTAYIDIGACQGCNGQGHAWDDSGNDEAVTNIVYSNPSAATSQFVQFGSGFVKTGYTYVAYSISLSQYATANGIEYYEY